MSSFCENFARLPWRTIFSHCRCHKFLIKVAYLAADAVLLSGIVCGKYRRERGVVAE